MRNSILNLILTYIIVGFVPIKAFGECSIIDLEYININENAPLEIGLFYNNLVARIDKTQKINNVLRENSRARIFTVSINGINPICEGESSNFTAVPSGGTGSYSYLWSTAETTMSITVSMPGTYTVTVTDNGTSEMADASKMLIVNAKPTASSGSNTPVCEGGTINLNSSGGVTYVWNGPNGYSTNQQNPSIVNAQLSNGGLYTVTVTGSNGCTSTSSTSVVVNAKPTASSGSNTPVCEGGTINLNSSGGVTYIWNGPNGYSSSQQNPSIVNAQLSNGGLYTVTVTGSNGCTSTSSTSVMVNAKPTASSGSNTPVCEAGTINLNSSGGVTYVWNGPNGYSSSQQNPSIVNAQLSNGGLYTVTVTGSNGCTSTSSTSVVVNAKPTASSGSNTPVCEGGTINLNSSGGVTYVWNGPNGYSTNQQNPSIVNAQLSNGGLYTVTVTGSNGCTSTSSTSVVVNAKPTASSGSNTPVCEGGTINLNSSGGVTYVWNGPNGYSTNQQNPSIVNAQLSNGGLYTVTVTGSNGCTSTSSTSVVVNAKPTASSGSNTPVCEGGTINLNSSGGVTYVWNGPNGYSTSQQNPSIVNAQLSNGGLYTVTVTGSNGCTSTSSTSVMVNAKPTASSGSNTPVCEGGTINLNSSGGVTYVWNGPNGYSTSQQNPSIVNAQLSNGGLYTVTVTGSNGCTSTSSTSVMVNVKPIAGMMIGDNFVCKGAMNFLSISGNSIPGGWSSNNTNVITVDNSGKVMGQSAGSAVIKYTVVSSSGCKDSVQKDINVPFVNAGLISGPDQVCKQADISLKINGNSSQGLWSSSNTNFATVDNSGKVFGVNVGQALIKYLVIGLNGCKDSVSQVIKINEKPSAGLISGANMLCKGSMIILTITGNSILGGWSSNDLSVLVVNAQGQVTGIKQGKTSVKYLVVSSEGCRDSILKDVTVNPLPNPGSISSNNGRFELCDDSNLDLTSNGDLNGKWSSSKLSVATITQVNGKLTAISPGVSTIVYSVTNSFGCVDSISKDFTVNSNPKVQIDGIGSICKNDTTEFIAEVMEGTPTYFYAWDKGSSLGSKRNKVSQAGIYNVSVTDSKGCKGITSKELKLFKLPFSNFEFLINSGNNYNIDITNQSYPTESGAVIVKYELYIDGVKKLDSSNFKSYNHTFVTTGIHKIILKVTDSNGCMNIIEKTYKIQDLKCDDLAFKINFSSKDSTYCYRGNDSIFIDLELNESKIFQSSNGIDSFSIPRFIITNGKGGNFRDTLNKVISSSGKDRFIKIPVNKLRTGKESFIVEVTVLYLNSTGGKDPLICSAELPYEIFDTVNITLERDSFCFKDSKNLTLIKSNGNNVTELKINGQLRSDFNSSFYPFPIAFGARDSLLNIFYEIKSEGGCSSKGSLKAYGFSLPPKYWIPQFV
jgi:hypothetical protein